MHKWFAYLAGAVGGIAGVLLSLPLTSCFFTAGMAYSIVGHLILLFLLGFHALLLGTFGTVMGYQLVKLLVFDPVDEGDAAL
ncbi:MAG: hypothetical protein MK108_02840 [Mariniblastus sp.]|nr:hypothetical protein [Mariniblastus sp.]